MNNKKNNIKGITLIALVVTIIVIIILAGISLNLLLGENGLIKKAMDAAELYKDAAKREQDQMDNINKYLSGMGDSSNYLTNDDEDDIGQPKHVSSYDYVGNIKYYSPDLTGFNAKQTYYVVYDSEGNESIPGRIDVLDAPEGWHDYENKKWANIVTINDSTITYWVWIPRFMYNYVSSSNYDVYFVDDTNTCTLKNEGVETTFKPETIDGKNYILSDAFKFDNTDLKGYWITKYQLQYEDTINYKLFTKVNGNQVTLYTNAEGGPYTLYVNGVITETNVTLPKTLTINPNESYQFMVRDENTGKIRTTPKREKIIVDLSGFNPDRTYYVEYDENGNEIIEKTKIAVDANGMPTNAPKDWYYYGNRKWANIVTVNDNQVTYWTYVPRYEYRTVNFGQGSIYYDTKYITQNDTVDQYFNVSDAFTFDGKSLHGYWITKYQLQYDDNSCRIQTRKEGNNLIINTTYSGSTYILYINGNKVENNVVLPKTIQINNNQEYFIMLIEESTGKIITTETKPNIQIDLSGFNPDCTYYVEYDANGNEIVNKTKIQVNPDGTPANAPENWYDYYDKKWANIMTNNNGLITYWTYIPRYEYRQRSLYDSTVFDIKYLGKTDSIDINFVLSDAFIFDGKQLSGYWITKYQLQEQN